MNRFMSVFWGRSKGFVFGLLLAIFAQAGWSVATQVASATSSYPTPVPGYSEGLDQAMDVCTALDQPHLRDRCRRVVGQARFFVPTAVGVCKGISFAPSVAECIEVIADQPYREAEARSCGTEDGDRRKIDCFKSLREPTYPGHPGNDTVSRSHVRQQIRSALDMMDMGNFYLARQILTSLLWELDRNATPTRRPSRPDDDRSRQ